MKKQLFLYSAIAILLFTLNGCKKYPDGPVISLRSKAERVANNWKVSKVLDDGKDVTSDYNKYELTLTKGSEANLTAKYVVFGNTFEFSTDGTWAFVSNNEKLSFNFDNNAADGVYQILKLEEEEMWLKEDAGSRVYHFVPR
ncbi:MAG: hypothetical protein SGJ00_10985 [bacterium]|nr:hypothetical protein [bacterium]